MLRLRRFAVCAAIAVSLASSGLAAQAPQLLANLQTQPDSQIVDNGRAGAMVSAGGMVLFAGTDWLHGTELWVTTGKTGTTRLLLDINPYGSSVPRAFVFDGRRTWFVAEDGEHGPEVWVSDGTVAGTRLTADVRPGPSQRVRPLWLTPFRGGVVFAHDDGVHGLEPWIVDSAGARLVRDIAPGSRGSSIIEIAAWNGQLWISADDGVAGRELWRSDGTAAGTIRFDLWPGAMGSSPYVFRPVGAQHLLFAAVDPNAGLELWRTDGTVAGTRMVVDLSPGITSTHFFPHEAVVAGGLLFFVAQQNGGPLDLWRSDGTAAGTFAPRPWQSGGLSDPGGLVAVGTRVCVRASDGRGWAIFVSDGTAAGTLRLAPLVHLSGVASGRGVYLNCGTAGIWYSDLTPGVVYPAFDKRYVTGSLTALAPDAALLAYGNELWRLEPRAAAQRVHGLARRVDLGSQPSRPASLGSVGLFSAWSATGSWRTDGTPAGTVALSSRSVPVLAQRGRVLANNQRGPSEPLWASDGTAAAPSQLTPAGVTVTSPVQPLGADRVWFRAADATFGTEPWTSDGTLAGTRRWVDLTPGAGSSQVLQMVQVDARYAALLGTRASFGDTLWWSDGTVAGTTAWSLARTQSFGVPLALGGKLLHASQAGLFAAVPGRGLDTALFPERVSAPVAWRGEAWFVARVGELWRSDGSPSGTRFVVTLGSSTTQSLRVVAPWGEGLLLEELDRDNVAQLWWCDGTAGGTRPLARFSSSVAVLSELGERLLVAPAESGPSRPLWVIDKAGGRRFVANQIGGSWVSVVGGRVLFDHDDGRHGLEVWSWDPGALAVPMPSGCGGAARLAAPDPRLGARLAIAGSDLPADIGFAALWLGAPLLPMPRVGDCALAGSLDALVGAFAVRPPAFVRPLDVPGAPALLGAQVVLQAVFAAPSRLELPPGVLLRLGR